MAVVQEQFDSISLPQSQIIGKSAEFQNLLSTVKIVAATDVTILINGESGTGKELIAQYIHNESNRHGQAFVSLNCAAIPESIAESELFGHKKGAFTGAYRDNPGKIATAHQGSLFLDEISELPWSIQGKVLRFLESNECQAVGENSPRLSDARIICASNQSLLELCQAKKFRQDLFFRLNVVPLYIPPLRERRGDIELLLNHFCKLYANQYQLPPIKFHGEALSLLKKYHWPGNIRELKNCCERLSILFPGMTIHTGNLPHEMTVPHTSESPIFRLPQQGIRLKDLEREVLCQALEIARGNISQAARLLGLSRHSFSYRYKKLGLTAQP